MVGMLWNAWISPKSLNLDVKSGMQVKPILTPTTTQNMLWWSYPSSHWEYFFYLSNLSINLSIVPIYLPVHMVAILQNPHIS